jgi:spore maturation protein CgeB
VLPGAYDTWGLVINEAMHWGLPCVVSDMTGCHRELVDPGTTGFVHRWDNAGELQDYLQRFLDLPDLAPQLGRNALARIETYRITRTVEDLTAASLQLLLFPDPDIMRVLIVGNPLEYHVGAHFLAAARSLQWHAEIVDLRHAKSSNVWVNRICHHLLNKYPAHLHAFGRSIVKRCRDTRPDFVLATGLAPLPFQALREIRAMDIKMVNFLTDDPWNPSNSAGFFWPCLREYDLIANPRQANLAELRLHGCRRVEYLPFGYNPDYHFIESNPTRDEITKFSCDVAILGAADSDRVPLARGLAAAKMNLALYGGYWDRYSDLKKFYRGNVFGRDSRLAVNLASSHVCMGRKANRDGHAMRSIELPAMGACLLVEETEEHRMLYHEGQHPLPYWQDVASLVAQARTVVNNSALSQKLRDSSYQHIVINGRHAYADRLQTIVSLLSDTHS